MTKKKCFQKTWDPRKKKKKTHYLLKNYKIYTTYLIGQINKKKCYIIIYDIYIYTLLINYIIKMIIDHSKLTIQKTNKYSKAR